jgi:succinate dehydrogenase / fumarate reductase cytochrome b subunit
MENSGICRWKREIRFYRTAAAIIPAMSEAAARAARRPRPKYLNLQALLFEIRLPVTGWVSILHRISGALLFVAMVWLLWMLDRSLSSEAAFRKILHYANLWPVKLSLLVLLWAYCHHFCAGIRYLFLDLDKGVDKETAIFTSWVVFGASFALTALLGSMLW